MRRIDAALVCALALLLLAPQWAAGKEAATPRASRPAAKTETVPARGRLLVASRRLDDPNFAQTVILLLSYGQLGAMGVVINRPSDVRAASVLQELKELKKQPDLLFLGGPVAVNRLLLLVRAGAPPDRGSRIFGDVYVSGSIAALRKALGSPQKGRWRVYAGYAGWGPGQLDFEIKRGDWYVAPADGATVFETKPEEVWPRLIRRFSGEWVRAFGPSPAA